MSNKKRPRGRPPRKDGHKPGRPVRIRHALIVQVDKASQSQVTSSGELINRYVREGLERDGFWPPKDSE